MSSARAPAVRDRRCWLASNTLRVRGFDRAATRGSGARDSDGEEAPGEEEPRGPPGFGWMYGGETRDGTIKVWTRPAPKWSGARANIKEVHAECEFRGVSRERFWNAVCDLGRYDEFVPFVAEARILRHQGAKDRVYTILITENRDKREKNVCSASWATTKEYEPPTPRGLARMRANCGSWHVSDLPQGDGIRVRYSLISDPGEGVPAWLLKRMTSKTVPDVLRAFRDRALSGKSEPVRAKPPPLPLVSNVTNAFETVMENSRAFLMGVRDKLLDNDNNKKFFSTTFIQQHLPFRTAPRAAST
eukprot:CAMPEP_0179713140 /NCGR_PEP_ID=MMETSP0938-20121108/167_1 /TAXON_ID=548131 ORGANISM="Ostreococcus mediterraneus, Strain clade-D-RCC1107" /NCGR_SAMPLE_ID=MMETSP0938 /ASSEMBLY_ACC=CAM_ASM_000576 /LENGTH=302 /DNA_ID=CAMNT_0021586757 /DNA_START=33 /DNA_END=941 /DNA_ORIENTATION=-